MSWLVKKRKGVLRTEGLSPEVVIMSAFCTQARSARNREIEFHFSFAEWVAWWEQNLGPDWFEKRGPHRNQHVMARDGDKGPYASWNVRCVTVRQNCKEIKLNGGYYDGENAIWAKLNADQVREIYLTTTVVAATARKFKLNPSTIRAIMIGKSWANVTSKLGPPPSAWYRAHHLVHGNLVRSKKGTQCHI